MKELFKKILGKEQAKTVLKDKIIYVILSDRKNLYKR
jgi:hypothetical protein